MAKAPGEITRSHRFTLAFQLEGLCEGLRNAAQHDRQLGQVTVALVRKLRQDLLSIIDSPAVKGLPEVEDQALPGDLLVLAEVLNATLKSFLNADEVKGFKDSAATWLGLAAKAKSLLGA